MRSVKITPWITVSSSLHKDAIHATEEVANLAYQHINALSNLYYNAGYLQPKVELVKIEAFATKEHININSFDDIKSRQRYWIANALIHVDKGQLTRILIVT